jgi:hypothetical protein
LISYAQASSSAGSGPSVASIGNSTGSAITGRDRS